MSAYGVANLRVIDGIVNTQNYRNILEKVLLLFVVKCRTP